MERGSKSIGILFFFFLLIISDSSNCYSIIARRRLKQGNIYLGNYSFISFSVINLKLKSIPHQRVNNKFNGRRNKPQPLDPREANNLPHCLPFILYYRSVNGIQ